jgi:CheY-like chemotaxis protein
VYGVVRESGGALNVSSEIGKGTTVCMTLKHGSEGVDTPTSRPAARIEDPAPTNLGASGVRVLVVDDDRLVRRFMAESLKGMGHDVTDTADGATALDLMDRHHFDLLLVDYAMPGMNGADVARAARAKHPKLRILVVSGYADSAALEAAMGTAAQLRKPFDVAELRAAVVDVLAY